MIGPQPPSSVPEVTVVVTLGVVIVTLGVVVVTLGVVVVTLGVVVVNLGVVVVILGVVVVICGVVVSVSGGSAVTVGVVIDVSPEVSVDGTTAPSFSLDV